MSKDTRPIEVGDRFETRDRRDTGRVIEVRAALGLTDRAQRYMDTLSKPGARVPYGESSIEDAIEWHRLGGTKFLVVTEVHPRNPSAVGAERQVNERTIRVKYRRISR